MSYRELICTHCGNKKAYSNKLADKQADPFVCPECVKWLVHLEELEAKLTTAQRLERVERWMFEHKHTQPISEVYLSEEQ